MTIELVPIGDLDGGLLTQIALRLESTSTTVACEISSTGLDPTFAYAPQRSQYGSTDLIRALETQSDANRVVGVATVDLFIPVLTYVFGEALLHRPAAVISLKRLDPTFYGLPPDLDLLLTRAATEILHELGHTFGLMHCHSATCVMRSSHSPEEIDLKGSELCIHCQGRATALGHGTDVQKEARY